MSSIRDSQSLALLAVVLDGSRGAGSRTPCRLCRRPLVEFTASAGLRATGFPASTVVCVNTKTALGVPCIAALKAKGLLTRLGDVCSNS